ncbi:MAG: hypothetical protein HKN44_11845 [Ilumatobacter sp.]|nr:hypothetical protein [Ilumatobacter sp.]
MTDANDSALPERTSPPLDAPDAAALIDAVAAWLHDDLLPRSQGADRWTLRIAANALGVAAREVVAGPAAVEAHAARLAALGYDTERALCAAIREGIEDDRFHEVLDAVAASVADGLAIANPTYRQPSNA